MNALDAYQNSEDNDDLFWSSKIVLGTCTRECWINKNVSSAKVQDEIIQTILGYNQTTPRPIVCFFLLISRSKGKRREWGWTIKMEFLSGYREGVVDYRVKKIRTEHKKGFLSDMKINESIIHKDRHDSTYRPIVKRWLQTSRLTNWMISLRTYKMVCHN